MMLLIIFWLWVPDWKIGSIDMIMDTGRGRTLIGGGSSFSYVARWIPNKKIDFYQCAVPGVFTPMIAKICPMECRNFLTDYF